MMLKPYISIDTETTSLSPDDGCILEVAAILDDGISPIHELNTFRAILPGCARIYGEPYALSMHSELLREISLSEVDKDLAAELAKWIYNVWYKEGKTYIENIPTLAGKNLSEFDLKFIKKECPKFIDYKHRIIDVGNLYFSEFGYVPSLTEINKLINYKPVAHRALDDALNVVWAIRYKLGMIK